MDRFTKWAEREFSLSQRVLATFLAAIFFVIVLPVLIVGASSAVDGWLKLPRFTVGPVNRIVGGFMAVSGWLLAIWSVFSQLTHGRGTPLPVMATQTLLTAGPFAYCRNPMSLGTIVMYLGVGVWVSSYSAIGLFVIFSVWLVLHLKLVEEKELEARFGQAYSAYKARTPFLIPHIRRASRGRT